MSYKTLIIIDNSSELTTLNQQIIRETVKCFIKNTDREDRVAVAVTGEKAEYLTDYEDSLNTQLKTVDEVKFQEINAPGADVLMEVLLSWKESDLAYRDILYIGGRDIDASSDYSEEELLFEVNNKQYPVYTLACTQNENTAAVKGLSSLSRISGGVSVSTDDAKSDAEVEKQLSEMLLKAMQEHRRIEQEELLSEEDSEAESTEEYEDEESDEEMAAIDEAINAEENMSPPDEEISTDANVIYDRSLENGKDLSFIYPVIVIILVSVVFAVSIAIKRYKCRKDEEKQRKEYEGRLQKKPKEPFEDVLNSETVCLSASTEDDSDTGTRLLYQTKEGIDITLEDRANPTKYFRACVRDAIVIGRNDKMCDIPITYDDSISSRHCEIYKRDGELYCRDLGSSNGTMINQQKIYQEIKIESGDILRIGRLTFFVQIVGDSYAK